MLLYLDEWARVQAREVVSRLGRRRLCPCMYEIFRIV